MPTCSMSSHFTYVCDRYGPTMKVMNVAKTEGPALQRKENALTAVHPNPINALPYQASAIVSPRSSSPELSKPLHKWKYDPADGRITPTFIALNGTRLPADIRGGLYDGDGESGNKNVRERSNSPQQSISWFMDTDSPKTPPTLW